MKKFKIYHCLLLFSLFFYACEPEELPNNTNVEHQIVGDTGGTQDTPLASKKD